MGDGHSKEDIKKHVKLYIGIFIALLVGTVLTVAAAYVDLGHKMNIALALLLPRSRRSWWRDFSCI
jgi:hypothetical protein